MIADHFQNMPKLAHTVVWTCPECKQKDEELNIKTAFYEFRRTLTDERKWGVPLHVIRVVKKTGNEIFVIKGESKREEVQNFLDKNLQKG